MAPSQDAPDDRVDYPGSTGDEDSTAPGEARSALVELAQATWPPDGSSMLVPVVNGRRSHRMFPDSMDGAMRATAYAIAVEAGCSDVQAWALAEAFVSGCQTVGDL
jgi:hypothetical protein